MQLSGYRPIFTPLNTSHLEETLFKIAGIFSINCSTWDLYMSKVSGQNSKLRFFNAWGPPQAFWYCLYWKNLISQSYHNCNPNPFRIFTRALCSIYRRSFIEIRGYHLGRFPVSRLSYTSKCDDNKANGNFANKIFANRTFANGKSPWVYWQKSTVLSPIGEIPWGVLAKVQCTFAIGETPIGEILISERAEYYFHRGY